MQPPAQRPEFQLLLSGQLRPILGLPNEEFAVLFIVGPGGAPLALAACSKHSAMVGDIGVTPIMTRAFSLFA